MNSIIFRGTVTPNKRNGTKFGYPTANIFIDDKNIEGLFLGYTTLLKTDDKKVENAFKAKMPSLIFVGKAVSVGEQEHRLETYILDFPNIDTYGSMIEIEIVEKLRENKKFDSIEELIEQMKDDEAWARKWFKI